MGSDDDDLRELGEWYWWIADSGRLLHWLRIHAQPEELGDVSAIGTTACGRHGTFHIPGLFSRQSMPRCDRCCRVLGYPSGVGSPKNDDACRPLVTVRLERSTA